MVRCLPEEKYEYEERLAICMHDGGLSYADALRIADKQLWDTIRREEARDRADARRAPAETSRPPPSP